ncbi:MAG: hypothetical protein ACYSUI_11675 [Planctomycetota bacterium]
MIGQKTSRIGRLSRPCSAAALCATWLVLAGPATATLPEWVELGPAPITNGGYTGRISAVACSPTDADKYFVAAADGGVWRTTNGGASWTPLTESLPTAAMGALAMDPTDENVLYAGTGEANFANHSRYGLGLYRTHDGGETWEHLAEGTFAGRCFSRIVVDPANPAVLYAAVTHAGGFPAAVAARGHPQTWGALGVFKSTDSGATWTHLTNRLPALSATDLAIDPSNPQVLYAAIGDIFGQSNNGIYRSIDGGASWAKLSGGLPTINVGRISLAISPSNPMVLYSIHTNTATATGGGASTIDVYKTSNGGMSWTPQNSGNFQASYGWYLSTAIVHPTDSNTVVVGGLTLLRSTNGGGNWFDRTPPHVDMHALAWDAAGRLVVGDDGGIHRTNDLGNSWTSHNDGLGCIQFYAGLSLSPADPDYVYGGTQDNGTLYRPSAGMSWTHLLGGDGGYTGVRPAHPNYVFAEYQGSGNLYRSTNYGSGMSYSGSGISSGDRNCFLPPFAINPDNDVEMLYGTHRVYYSSSAGSSWSVRSGDLSNGGGAIRCLVLAPSVPQTVYAVTNDGNVQVSTDFGISWTLSLAAVPGWPRTTRQIAVDPDDDQRAILAVSNFGLDQLLLTEDRGTSWTPIDGDLPDIPVNTVAIASWVDHNIFYAGTDAGVYLSVNGGQNWTRLGANLPNAPVIDLIVDPANKRLLAGTQGRGAWTISILRTGDFNGDNDLDLEDFQAFQGCMGASALDVPSAACLEVFDTNGDQTVDLADFTDFEMLLTGPA